MYAVVLEMGVEMRYGRGGSGRWLRGLGLGVVLVLSRTVVRGSCWWAGEEGEEREVERSLHDAESLIRVEKVVLLVFSRGVFGFQSL